MAVYYPVTPSGRVHDGSHHQQWGTSPGYMGPGGLVSYAQHIPHQAFHHSPSSIPQPPPLRPQSTTPQQPLTHHWQQQLIKYEASRGAAAPHHRARTSAMTLRNTTKNAITITDPNSHKRAQGSISDKTDTSTDESVQREGTPGLNGHPSSTAAPVSSPPVVPRPSATRTAQAESMWTTLDMGGMRLKNLATSLFKLNYITTLYVNHNQLNVLSPDIAKLRNLVHLDLSSNQLSTVPPELGMLTSLKELLLFDNHLETLPPQLGSLHQLTMLGIEGNPMQQTLRSILQKEGTPALIAYLRDSCPVPLPPPERQWKYLQTPAQREALDADFNTSERFTLLCYNILCERYATSSMYGYTPSWALAWDYRRELILTEIANYEADFLCLQEVDAAQYEEYFTTKLESHGYDGIFASKSRARTMNESQRRLVDGCAIFFKKEKYSLVESQLIEFNQFTQFAQYAQRDSANSVMSEDMYNRVLTKDNIAIVALLENKHTGSKLIIANVHVHWDPEFRDVKLIQSALLMEELEKIATRFVKLPPKLLDPPVTNGGTNGSAAPAIQGDSTASGDSGSPSTSDQSPPVAPVKPQQRKAPVYDSANKIPTIVCGDFNSIPSSGVYEFLSTGAVPPNHVDFMSHKYGKYTDEGMKHSLSLKSAYAAAQGGAELPITNYTPSFKGVIDYIWFSNQSLTVEGVLGEVDEKYLEKVVGFPNAHFPSDHVCIIADFRVNRQKEVKEGGPVSGARPTAFTNGTTSRNTRK
ncbi:Glucose-repressible alcohol dehydrogenase transcriptional effector [Tulasnella sp. 419]|nr:Glucose-repressible alcohol dehydrogenase transcriptional effector [Tulasnella sp. 419]